MPITQKKSTSQTRLIGTGHPLPFDILNPLPVEVAQRFPSLVSWQDKNEKIIEALLDALERRQTELDNAIAALTKRVEAIE